MGTTSNTGGGRGGLPHLGNGGYPIWTIGDTPIWTIGGTPTGGNLSSWWGIPWGTSSIGTGWRTPCQDWMGVSHLLGLDGGTPIGTGWGYPYWDWMGYPMSQMGCPPPIRSGWGTLHQDWRAGGGYPHQDRMEFLPPCWNWMGLPPPIRRLSSKVSNCYAVGGMPLAFTQEDFHVWINEIICTFFKKYRNSRFEEK